MKRVIASITVAASVANDWWGDRVASAVTGTVSAAFVEAAFAITL
jgi:hypothetical protein